MTTRGWGSLLDVRLLVALAWDLTLIVILFTVAISVTGLLYGLAVGFGVLACILVEAARGKNTRTTFSGGIDFTVRLARRGRRF